MKIVLTVGDLVYNVHFFFVSKFNPTRMCISKKKTKKESIQPCFNFVCILHLKKEHQAGILRQKKERKKLTSGISVNVCCGHFWNFVPTGRSQSGIKEIERKKFTSGDEDSFGSEIALSILVYSSVNWNVQNNRFGLSASLV